MFAMLLADDPGWYQAISAGSSLVAIIGGLIAAFLAVHEARVRSRQNEQEFKWRQAKEAKSLVDEIDNDPMLRDVSLMIDWDARAYRTPAGEETITRANVLNALRTANLQFSETESHIRDLFDRWFGYFEQMEHSVRVGLVSLGDIQFPFAYFASRMARTPQDKWTFEQFMQEYDYDRALAFLNRFDAWSAIKSEPAHETSASSARMSN